MYRKYMYTDSAYGSGSLFPICGSMPKEAPGYQINHTTKSSFELILSNMLRDQLSQKVEWEQCE